MDRPAARDSSDRLLVWLGLVLPREFVRRVAEPALADERFRWARSGRPPLARTRFVCACLWVGVPRIFWDGRKPTRVTLALVGCAIVLIAGLLIYLPTRYPALPGP